MENQIRKIRMDSFPRSHLRMGGDELDWIKGLNALKGMAIYNNNISSKLYVSDITDLIEIDIEGRKITNHFNAPGSAFLNDVALDDQGNNCIRYNYQYYL
jgi:hypothetical protein